jgi:hypothetical protein
MSQVEIGACEVGRPSIIFGHPSVTESVRHME